MILWIPHFKFPFNNTIIISMLRFYQYSYYIHFGNNIMYTLHTQNYNEWIDTSTICLTVNCDRRERLFWLDVFISLLYASLVNIFKRENQQIIFMFADFLCVNNLKGRHAAYIRTYVPHKLWVRIFQCFFLFASLSETLSILYTYSIIATKS